jgi:endonuclease V-like protein UPF0215 family
MHIAKKGLRVLGIAESFTSENRSILAGVVMRKDLRIDGFSFETTTVGGMDATDSVVSLYRNFNRQDINVIMISGCVISWFNIIDPWRVREETGRPTIVVTYEDSEGIEEDIMHYFPHDEVRLSQYLALGTRIPHSLPTGHTIYIRPYGMSEEDAGALCSAFTYDGKIPDPLRVARLCARAVMHYLNSLNEETSFNKGI